MRYYNKLLILAMLAGLGTGCTPTDNQESDSQKTLPQVGWYMRIVSNATTSQGKVYTHNTAGVFGELDESIDGLDRHDVPAKGSAILQVRLVNDDLDSTQEYYSDYRSYDQNDTKQSWDFMVINNDNSVDLSNASLNLDIQNLKQLYKSNGRYTEVSANDTKKRDSIKLIDLDNQTVYSYTDLKTANLHMDGKHIRKFRLVLGEVTQDDMQVFVSKIQIKPYKLQTFTDGFGLPPE